MEELDALVFQDTLDGIRHLFVLTRRHAARAARYDGYAAAHAAVELAHLKPDDTAPDYGYVLREIRMLQPVAGVYVIDFVQSVYRWDRSPRAGV